MCGRLSQYTGLHEFVDEDCINETEQYRREWERIEAE